MTSHSLLGLRIDRAPSPQGLHAPEMNVAARRLAPSSPPLTTHPLLPSPPTTALFLPLTGARADSAWRPLGDVGTPDEMWHRALTGEKRFVDSTFTAGPDRVEYTVQAQRADSAGPVSNIVVVNFGLPGVGTCGAGGFSVSTLDNPDHLGGSDTPIATPGFQGSTRKLRTGKRHAA